MSVGKVIWSVAVLGVIATAQPAAAQDTRYRTWGAEGSSASGSADTRLQNMMRDLNALIDEARKARAADPVLLSDLEALVARYDSPWTVRQLFDDFTDNEITRDPTWSVTSGRFWVERGFGLRSEPQAGTAAQTNSSSTKMNDKELALKLLGSVLQGSLGKKGTVTTTTPATPSKPAVARLAGRVSNAFAVSTHLTSWKKEGSFELGLYQGAGGDAGYRVVYSPGTNPTLELVLITSRGRSVIESATRMTALEDEGTHAIYWTRDVNGQMTVSIDGKEVMIVRDRSFRDAFSGLVLFNSGADIIVKDIAVMGLR